MARVFTAFPNGLSTDAPTAVEPATTQLISWFCINARSRWLGGGPALKSRQRLGKYKLIRERAERLLFERLRTEPLDSPSHVRSRFSGSGVDNRRQRKLPGEVKLLCYRPYASLDVKNNAWWSNNSHIKRISAPCKAYKQVVCSDRRRFLGILLKTEFANGVGVVLSRSRRFFCLHCTNLTKMLKVILGRD